MFDVWDSATVVQTMLIKVPYGDDFVQFNVEKERLIGIFDPPEVSPAADENLEIEGAIANPVGSPSLADLMKKGRSLAIAVDDVTRPTPCSKILPPLLSRAKRAGIRRENVKIIAALGTHRNMAEKELKEKCGPEIFEDYQVINHSFDDQDELKFLQTRKIPIWINRHFLKADLKIGIGYVVPHCNAGWSGGSKIVLPGLSGAETVAQMHLHGANNVGSVLGKTENPLRALIDFCAKKVGLHSVFNVVLKGSSIVKSFYGDPIKAHREGVIKAKEAYGVRMPCKADITVSTAYPFDKFDFWQADRAVASADLTTRDGGAIVVVAPFSEGVSATHPEFGKLLPYAPKEINEMIRRDEVEDLAAAAGAIHLTTFRLKKKICIVSDGIGCKKAERLGFLGFKTVEEALEMISHQIKPSKRIAILSQGGIVLPLFS